MQAYYNYYEESVHIVLTSCFLILPFVNLFHILGNFLLVNMFKTTLDEKKKDADFGNFLVRIIWLPIFNLRHIVLVVVTIRWMEKFYEINFAE